MLVDVQMYILQVAAVVEAGPKGVLTLRIEIKY